MPLWNIPWRSSICTMPLWNIPWRGSISTMPCMKHWSRWQTVFGNGSSTYSWPVKELRLWWDFLIVIIMNFNYMGSRYPVILIMGDRGLFQHFIYNATFLKGIDEEQTYWDMNETSVSGGGCMKKNNAKSDWSSFPPPPPTPKKKKSKSSIYRLHVVLVFCSI